MLQPLPHIVPQKIPARLRADWPQDTCEPAVYPFPEHLDVVAHNTDASKQFYACLVAQKPGIGTDWYVYSLSMLV